MEDTKVSANTMVYATAKSAHDRASHGTSGLAANFLPDSVSIRCRIRCRPELDLAFTQSATKSSPLYT